MVSPRPLRLFLEGLFYEFLRVSKSRVFVPIEIESKICASIAAILAEPLDSGKFIIGELTADFALNERKLIC